MNIFKDPNLAKIIFFIEFLEVKPASAVKSSLSTVYDCMSDVSFHYVHVSCIRFIWARICLTQPTSARLKDKTRFQPKCRLHLVLQMHYNQTKRIIELCLTVNKSDKPHLPAPNEPKSRHSRRVYLILLSTWKVYTINEQKKKKIAFRCDSSQ